MWGEWTQGIRTLFPESHIYLFEANSDHRDILQSLGFPVEIVLLSKSDDIEVDYYAAKTGINTGNSIYREQTSYFSSENCEVRSS